MDIATLLNRESSITVQLQLVLPNGQSPRYHFTSRKPTGRSGTKDLPKWKYWEIIADNLKKRGWSWGCVSAIDSDRANARATTSAGLPVLY